MFETKTLVLVFKVDFNPKPWFGVEKLLNDNVYILEERGFLDTPPPLRGEGIQKIAERQNIYILEERGFLDTPPSGGGHPKNC